MLLHLKAHDGDLLLITEPALLTRCAWQSHSINRAALILTSVYSRGRVNDWLLKINDVDLANKDRKQVIKAVFSGGGVINMVVRRRKSLGGRMVTSVHLTLAGHKGQIVGLCLSGRPADQLSLSLQSLSLCL